MEHLGVARASCLGGARLVLARQWHMDCGAIGADGELPDPVDDFPTTPPTEQPALIAPQA